MKWCHWWLVLGLCCLKTQLHAQQFVNGNLKFVQKPGMYFFDHKIPFYGYGGSRPRGEKYIQLYKMNGFACTWDDTINNITGYDKGSIPGLDTLHLHGMNSMHANIDRLVAKPYVLAGSRWIFKSDSSCEINLSFNIDTLNNQGWSMKLTAPLISDSLYLLEVSLRSERIRDEFFLPFDGNYLPQFPWQLVITQSINENEPGEVLGVITREDVIGEDTTLPLQEYYVGSTVHDSMCKYYRLRKAIRGKNNGQYITIRGELKYFNKELSKKYFIGLMPDSLCCLNHTSLWGHIASARYLLNCPVSIVGKSILCDTNGSVVLHADTRHPWDKFYWSHGDTGFQVNISKPGRYILTRDRNGCKGEDTIDVSYLLQEKCAFDSGICTGNTIVLGKAYSQSSPAYSWNTGKTDCCISVSGKGNYIRTTKLNTCTYYDTFHIYEQKPLTVIKQNIFYPCFDSAVYMNTNGKSPQWIMDGRVISTDTSIIEIANRSKLIYLKTGFICRQTDSIIIKPIECGEKMPIWLPNAFTPDGNSNNDLFGYRNDKYWSMKEILIFNRWGQLIYRSNAPWNGNVQGNLCPTGVYAYIITLTYNRNQSLRTLQGTVQLIR